MISREEKKSRRGFLGGMAIARATAGLAGGLLADLRPGTRSLGVSRAHAQEGRYRMAFIQW